MTSRERMAAALAGEDVDYAPCSFMIFSALRDRCQSDADFVRRQVEMGLDALVATASWASARNLEHRDLPGIDIVYPDAVEVRLWRERVTEGPDVLHKECRTPAGILKTEVAVTPDWPYGDHVPLFDDYLVPRATRFPVATAEDLEALRWLLSTPDRGAVHRFRKHAAAARALAEELDLLLTGGMGLGIEAGAWLCGQENLVFLAVDQPELVDELCRILHEWNMARMKEVLSVGIDLFTRRGWYEGADFWSPPMFERFVLPYLQREADLAHDAGARFGYIHTTGTAPVLEQIRAAGVDVIIGVDPVQGTGTDLRVMRARAGERLALWGGVNGFVTVEMGSEGEIRQAVAEALETLGPRGLILSPVDNIRSHDERAWRGVRALIEAWQEMR